MFVFGHLVNRQSFLFLPDLKIKGTRRYQNYLSLLCLNFARLNSSLVENPNISPKPLDNLLKDEIREADIVGQGKKNELLVMLPYADMARVHKARESVERIL